MEAARGVARGRHDHLLVGRLALRRARRGHQGGAGRGRLCALVLRADRRIRRGRCRAKRSACTRRAIPTRCAPRSMPACARSSARPGSTPPPIESAGRSSRSSRTSCARPGTYLSREAGIAAGAPMAYLIAPPLESMIALDAAIKAASVRVAKWFGPPTETNFGGGYLVGDLPACEAAARAFAAAVVDIARAPTDASRSARAAGESLGARPRGPTGAGKYRVLATGERLTDKPEHLTHLARRRIARRQVASAAAVARQARHACRASCSTRSAPPTPTARAGSSANWARRSS